MAGVVWLCESGLKRSINQDRAGAFVDDGRGVFFVADGLGGHYAGEKASAVVADMVERWWHLNCKTLPSMEVAADLLQRLLQECDRIIRRETPPGKICGTTAVLLLIDQGAYVLLSVGDSRCYWVPDGFIVPGIQLLTVDDVVPEGSPGSGKLYRAIGGGPKGPIAVQCGTIDRSGLFVLCTDGIYKFCSQHPFYSQLRRAARTRDMEQAAIKIERAVCKNGAPDNYSLVLVQVGD